MSFAKEMKDELFFDIARWYCKKKKQPIIEPFYEIGLVGDKIKKHRARSFNRNFYNILYVQVSSWVQGAAYGAGSLVARGVVGTLGSMSRLVNLDNEVTTLTNGGYYSLMTDEHEKGIYFGSNNTAESFEDTLINTAIIHGVGAGNLYYSDMLFPSHTYDATTKIWTVQWERFGFNRSGGDVTCREMTLILRCILITSSHGCVVSRDVFPDIVVPNLRILFARYTLQLTFP